MLKPLKVAPLNGYKIRVQYSDGVEGEVDLSHLVGKGVFSVWNDPKAFENVRIGPGGEIKWSDEVELCPDSLYMEITGETPEEIFPNLLKASAILEESSTGEVERSSKEFVFPVIEEAEWPADVLLRREDMYGDDGR